MKKTVLSALLLAVALTVAGCSKAPITGRDQLIMIDAKQEMALGVKASKEVMEQNKETLDKNKALLKRVRTIGLRIAKKADRYVKEAGLPPFEWEFHTIAEPETLNAFCLPGGKVFVYSGITEAAKNDAQLATVMAHEIAHAIARHGAERMSSNMLIQLGGAVTVAVSSHRDLSVSTMQTISIAYGVGSGLGMLSHSRTQENEADYLGLMIMAEAGYDPRESLQFWKNMQAKDTKQRQLEFLSTHPMPKTRIEAMQKAMPEALARYKHSR